MPRNIVICCDGTSNDVTGDSTNVLRLFRSLERTDQQLIFYDPGVGTVSDPTKKTSLGKSLSRSLDMGVGFSVRENVCNIYRFLSQHYADGDQIYLFGFSRGAYTARAAAGMIEFLGLLRPEQLGLERHAWAIYADDDSRLATSERFKAGNRFEKSFTIGRKPRIHFMGVWDTVSSFGWFWNLRTLPYTYDNPSIRHVRHAVAIDERRAMFQPNRFGYGVVDHESFEEAWFAGGHGDVGGGWPESNSGLAKITLAWMFKAAIDHGLLVNKALMQEVLGQSPNRKDLVPPDARTPVNKTLRGLWWLVELIPRRQWKGKSKRVGWVWPQLGRRRRIPFGAAIHVSVGEKMKLDDSYRPWHYADP